MLIVNLSAEINDKITNRDVVNLFSVVESRKDGVELCANKIKELWGSVDLSCDCDEDMIVVEAGDSEFVIRFYEVGDGEMVEIW
jgi:hypothetical protein